MFETTNQSPISASSLPGSPPSQSVQGDAGELQILRAPAILSSPGGDQLPPRCIGFKPITSSRDGRKGGDELHRSTQQKGAQKLCERM